MSICCSGRGAASRWRVIVMALVGVAMLGMWIGSDAASAETERPQGLAVLWTSGDPEVAHRVAFMYTQGAASQDWFDEVQLIVWGPSARLLAADKDLQAAVQGMKEAGVEVKACVNCADSYGVTDQLREMGLEVKGMGQPLTDLLQDDRWEVLTF